MNRREAVAFLAKCGLLGSSLLQALEPSRTAGHVIIVGGGTGGLVSYALLRLLAPQLRITLIAPNDTHLYQSAQTFVAAGIMKPGDIAMPMKEFIDQKNTLADEVTAIEPQSSTLYTKSGKRLSYDYLILAAGLEYDYEAVTGLSSEDIGEHNIASIYLNNTKKGSYKGALVTRKWFEAVRKSCGIKPTQVLFTNPPGALKCGGAVLSTIFLLCDYVRGNGPKGGEDFTGNLHITFAKPGSRLFGISDYDAILRQHARSNGIELLFGHTLTAIDKERRLAVLLHKKRVKHLYDPDFEEWSYTTKEEVLQRSYDFIHITPPMRSPEFIRNGPCAKRKGSQTGYVEVDRETMRHKRFGNIFAVGDCAGVPLGKTAFAAKFQARTAATNLLALLHGKEPKAHYDGYSGCPIKLRYKSVLCAEFDYEGATKKMMHFEGKPKGFAWEYDTKILPQIYRGWLLGVGV